MAQSERTSLRLLVQAGSTVTVQSSTTELVPARGLGAVVSSGTLPAKRSVIVEDRPARKRRAVRTDQAAPDTTTPDTPASARATPADTTNNQTSTILASAPLKVCRCGWAEHYSGATSAAYVAYHDTEWGVPHITDRELFEHLTLDGAQAGLTWATILSRRAAYTNSFHDWDIPAVAAMTEEDVVRLLEGSSGVVRHRGKIESAINNAARTLEVQQEFGSLAAYMWGFFPNSRPIVNCWRSMKEVPTTSVEATALSKDMKRRGFKFVGPTMMYALVEAVGMVNDHCVTCFRYTEVQAAAEAAAWDTIKTTPQ